MKLQSVLLIDDNDVDNFIHRRVIDIMAFAQSVHACTSVKSAKEFIDTLVRSQENLPEIIFLDLNMPGENGFAFLEWFKEFSAKYPNQSKIVILTSSNNQADVDHVFSYTNVIKFITKPLKKDDLLQISP
ncbi:MAG: response regulator [Bacteroidia bacterium]|nr:response regulator [Bacteroidia bacterium]MDW8347334.1 response regulator [Bacteroidia bacterium]